MYLLWLWFRNCNRYIIESDDDYNSIIAIIEAEKNLTKSRILYMYLSYMIVIP